MDLDRQGPSGSVAFYLTRDSAYLETHEGRRQQAIARMIAELRGAAYAGIYESGRAYDGPLFLVPADTLVGLEDARALGITSPEDLFGGVVPHGFVKTKAIVHRLPAAGAARPAGWSEAFAEAVERLVVPGFTAFSRADALTAARRLLRAGPIRIKPALAAGGRDQTVVTSSRAAASTLDAIAADDLAEFGVVLETDLCNVTTYSVGQATVDGLTVSYYGVQHETPDNDGGSVYGGSDLVLVRGGWDRLLREPVDQAKRLAITAGIAFDCATRLYAGLIASRRNYDVGEGRAPDGRRVVGVFDQSWRIGGASGAEVLALRAFRDDPRLRRVEASTVEAYGECPDIPASAALHYHGVDRNAGPLACYSILRAGAAA